MTREEMLNECVSRDKAIVQLNHLKSDWDDDWNIAIRKCVETIKKLPSVTPMPKWIPVEIALPEVGSEVLVCYEFKKKRYVYIADFYGDGKFHGLDDEYLTTEGRKHRKAIAWMPLPTPPNMSEIQTGAEGSEKND